MLIFVHSLRKVRVEKTEKMSKVSFRAGKKSVSKSFDKFDLVLKMIQQASREYCAILPISVLRKMNYDSLEILSQRLMKIFYELQSVNMPFIKMDHIEDVINDDKILEDLVGIFYLKKKAIRSRAHHELFCKILNIMDGFYYNALLFQKSESGHYFYKHTNLLELWQI